MKNPRQEISQEQRRLPEHSWTGERSALPAEEIQRAQITETIETDMRMLGIIQDYWKVESIFY